MPNLRKSLLSRIRLVSQSLAGAVCTIAKMGCSAFGRAFLMPDYLNVAFNSLIPNVLLISLSRRKARIWSMEKKIPPELLMMSFLICIFAALFLSIVC